MSRKCYHCGEPLQEKDKVCPRCGAEATGFQKPKTIYELRMFCAQKHVPLAKMRFFLGEDYREPRAFGIYQDDDGQFVVYKNKADGSRAIRYRGPDEAHAVSEIYDKMDSEIQLRRAKKSGGVTRSSQAKKERAERAVRSYHILAIGSIIAFAILILLAAVIHFRTPSRGYYQYNDDYYYYYNDWYWYSDGSWHPAEQVDQALKGDHRDYRVDGYDSSYDVPPFEDSEWYEYESEKSSDNDNDWNDSDWDDWDSGDTDWDSDW